MEPEDYQALLEKYDEPDPAHAESPLPIGDFYERQSYADSCHMRRQAFLADLGKALGKPLEAEGAQDASFSRGVILPADDRGEGYFPDVELRFSNFGELAAVAEEESTSSEILELVRSLLAHHGFTYIPLWILRKPYTGKNPAIKGTWWYRYFEYI